VIVRTFTEADLPQVLALQEESLAASRTPVSRAEEIARKRERDPELLLVAERDGRLVGTVMGGYDGRRAYIYRLAVASDCRRRGVGRLLVAELERRFRALGAVKINLLVYRENRGARQFWAELGYPQDTDTVNHYKVLS
jgi:ribosomal protein S18 acetylase RimI-like enzyme